MSVTASTGRYGDIDYARLTKGGVTVSVTAFALAFLVQAGAHATGAALPGWEATLLTDVEHLSILGVVPVFGFGILLPLMEWTRPVQSP